MRVASDSGARLADAFVSASGVHSTELDRSASGPRYRLEPLVSAARKFRVVNDCVQHALVCQGRLHVAIDAVMEPWDSAALIPCVREAGGEASSLEGDRENVVFARSLVSAASDALLTEVLSVIDAG